MKKILLLRYFLLITFLGIGISQLKSQPFRLLTKEDFTSIESLSKALCKNINKDEKKVKAIHKWITHSIDYDFDLIIDVRPHFEYSSEEVFLTGKSMSEGYVNLMQSMLKVHNIPSQKIIGYTRLYNTDSALLPVYNDHAWIAIYLNGQWQLADPTKDAGYIGYRRTNKVDKVNKMKREWRQERDKKMAHFEMLKNATDDTVFLQKVEDRETNARVKLEKKRMKMLEKSERIPAYTKKLEFKRAALQRHFLIHPDSFLLTHFPVNQVWQLREYPIDIYTFMKGESAIRTELKNNTGESINYLKDIEEYILQNEEELLMENANASLHSNKENKMIQAKHHYLVLKKAMDIDELNKPSENIKMVGYSEKSTTEFIDQALEYNHQSHKSLQPYFKYINKFYEKDYKDGRSIAISLMRNMQKAKSWNDAAISDLGKAKDNIERQIHKWVRIRDRLYPSPAVDYQFESFDVSRFPAINKEHADSLKSLYQTINWNREIWHCQQIRSAIVGISKVQTKENTIFLDNAEFLRLRTFENNNGVKRDFQQYEKYQHTIELMYSDSLKREMFCKDYISSLNAFYRYMKMVDDELQANSRSIGFDEQRTTSGVIRGYALLQIQRFIEDLKIADHHLFFLQSELKNVGSYWHKLIKSAENQGKLNLEKMNFLRGKLAIRKRKEENTLLLMRHEIKRWSR